VTDTLVNNVNLDAFAPQNDITLVTLDAGYAGNQFVTGLDLGDTVSLLSGQQAGGSELFLILDNALFNTNDLLNLKLSGDVFHGTTDFGTIDLNPIGLSAVENVNLDSTTHNSGFVNKVVLEAPGIQNLTIQHDAGGDVSLRLDGSILGGSVTGSLNVQAIGFTGAITDNTQIGDNFENVTFNAPNSGSDSLIFGNGNDSVTLGNGNNFVQVGGGTDNVSVGNGNNTVTVINNTSHIDTLSFGSGANTVNLNGTNGTGSSITFAAHGANVDQVNFTSTGNSSFTLEDTINGFAQGHDVLNFGAIDGNAGNYTYQEVNGAVAVLAAVAGDTAGKHDIVLDKTDGNVYIDWNGNHLLSTADPDMQITLTGVNHLSLAGTTLV